MSSPYTLNDLAYTWADGIDLECTACSAESTEVVGDKSMVRPELECSVKVWDPYLKHDTMEQL